MNLHLLPYTPERDAYRLLGIPPSATDDEIALACRRLSRAFHPDVNRSPRATQEMQVVNVVRRVMTDPGSRAVYDRERYRFHAGIGRTPRPSLAPAVEPMRFERRPSSAAERYARAAMLGLRAALAAMAPPRCGGCRSVILAADAYCPGCGTPLLTTGA